MNNTVNTGAALRYVRNNILRHFHRSKGHSDVIAVSVEKHSNDDVTEAAAKLKEDGVMVSGPLLIYITSQHKIIIE